MTLLNPLLLAIGAVALAIPLWVHLRLGKVKKRATVGSLRLLRAAPQTSRSPRRLIRRALFALRCLITLLIALGFARLLMPMFGRDASVESTAIVLDVSGSMQAKNGDRTVWEIARAAALKHLDDLAPSAKVALVLSPGTGAKPEWTDPRAARAAIRELKCGYAANQLHADIATAVAALRAMPDERPKILHILSDFQRSSFIGIDQAAIPQNVRLLLTKTSPEKPANRGVAVNITQAGASTLRLYAYNDATPGTLALTENDAKNVVSLVAGRPATGTPATPRADGTILRQLRITESDDLAADNAALDIFRPQPEIPVALWQPKQAAATPKPETEQAAYFLSRALQPSENPADSISRFRPRTLNEDTLDATTATPPLLLIPAQSTYPDSLAKLAEATVAQGGAVVFFGGQNLAAGSLAPFGKLVPATPEGIENVPTTPALAAIGANDPLFGSLASEARQRLASAPLLRRHTVTVAPGARVLSRFADTKPFIVEVNAGRGKTYFVNTSADREFSDWAADAPRFIPAIHLLAAKAIEGKFSIADDAPFLAGEPRALVLGAALAGKTATLDGVKYPVPVDGILPAVVFDTPGEKTVLADGKSVARLAVNFPPRESTLDNLSEPVIRQRLESQRHHDGGATVRWETDGDGQLAWQLCLLIGALLLLVEPIIADRKATR
jgi:hypothetical protein